jgi:hypothetical protein
MGHVNPHHLHGGILYENNPNIRPTPAQSTGTAPTHLRSRWPAVADEPIQAPTTRRAARVGLYGVIEHISTQQDSFEDEDSEIEDQHARDELITPKPEPKF